MSNTRGVIYIHSAGAALRPHVEWAISGVLGAPVNLRWTEQPASPGTWRAELTWTGPADTASLLAAALKNCLQLRFEVTEDPGVSSDGQRYSFTPSLGVFHAAINRHGDIMVSENRIKAALTNDAIGARDLSNALRDLLGTRWDAELEVFRYAGEDTPVRWLHAAV